MAPWNGSGQFTRTDGTRTGTEVWEDARDAGVKIRADDHDTHDEDLADGLENTVALDGQNTTTTDNAILRYDTGQTAFTGAAIGASEIVGRSATGDVRGLSNTTARKVLGVASADSPNFGGVSISSTQWGYLGGLDSAPLEDDDLAANGGTVPETNRSNTFSENQTIDKGDGTRAEIFLRGDIADADGNIESVLWTTSDNASSEGSGRITGVVSELTGSTAGDRGGILRFSTKSDGSDVLTSRFYIEEGGVYLEGYSGQGAGTLNGELYDNGNRVYSASNAPASTDLSDGTALLAPGSSSGGDHTIGGGYRTPNASRAVLVVVQGGVTGNPGSLQIQVDESGGTTSDYGIIIAQSDSTEEVEGCVTTIIPPGGSYSLSNVQGSGTIKDIREFVL